MMNFRFSSMNLKKQLLILFFSLSVLPLLLSSVWGYWRTQHHIEQLVNRNVRNVAALEAERTKIFVTNSLTQFTEINRSFAQVLKAQPPKESPDELEQILRELIVQNHFKGTVFLLSDQAMVLTQASYSGIGEALQSDLALANSGRKPEIVGFGHESHIPSLLIKTKFPGVDKSSALALAAQIPFRIHWQMVADHEIRTTHASFFLVSEHGQILCGADENEHFEDFDKHIHRKDIPDFKESRGFTRRYHLEDGREVISAFSPIDLYGWGILVEAPVEEVMKPLLILKWQGIIGSFILVCFLTIIIYFTARALSKPYKTLIEVAQKTASGKLGEQVVLKGSEEIVQLANSFNVMSLALKESYQDLEVKITNRTSQLKKNQDFTEHLLDSLEQPVLVFDLHQKVLKANRSAFQAYGTHIINHSWDALFRERPHITSFNPVLETIQSNKPFFMEIGKDNHNILELRTFPIQNADGNVEAVVQISREITREKQLVAQMLYQEKMATFGLMTAGVAHEIGNPLASLLSQVRVMRDNPATDMSQGLDILDKELKRMSQLIRELVDFSRKKRDETVLISWNQVADDAIRLLRHDPRARAVTLVREFTENLPGMRVSIDPLLQVLINLCINALDAMPQGGSLTIETRYESGKSIVKVIDTGIGIPVEIQNTLFSPFFTTKKPGKGTGLGLFISKGIIKNLGGNLELEKSDSGGSTFCAWVPVEKKT